MTPSNSCTSGKQKQRAPQARKENMHKCTGNDAPDDDVRGGPTQGSMNDERHTCYHPRSVVEGPSDGRMEEVGRVKTSLTLAALKARIEGKPSAVALTASNMAKHSVSCSQGDIPEWVEETTAGFLRSCLDVANGPTDLDDPNMVFEPGQINAVELDAGLDVAKIYLPFIGAHFDDAYPDENILDSDDDSWWDCDHSDVGYMKSVSDTDLDDAESDGWEYVE